MLTGRQLCSALAVGDVVLFLVAGAFNDHSNTSIDGIVWWLALLVFLLLIAVGMYVLGRFLWTHRRQPKRARAPSGRPK
jgi:ABC-type nickel/cobalt efflux system permease component RcnA